MSKEASFDIVSDFDQQELVNAIDQTKREIGTRFDLKDTGSDVTLEENKFITILSTDEFKVRNIYDILENKVSKRGLDTKILQQSDAEDALGGKMRQKITLKRGIDQTLAKKIVAEIKGTKIKVQPSVQGEQVRVVGKSRDDLQAVISHVTEQAEQWGEPLQFTNYR
ncbi:MAG: YajQ family cyclic di-GMP-binding protein [Vampirovibrio sp.]|nr:YajQ family cyclic di-GMP-binding protein [Vampirovibrio sp.]